MNKKKIILIGLGLWILLGILCLLTHAKKIENKLASQAREQLKLANLADLEAVFSGRDALLSGTVPADELIQNAEKLIREITGVRTVDNRLALAEIPTAVPETSAVVAPVQAAEVTKNEKAKIDLSAFQINFESDSYQLGGNSATVLNQIQQKLTAHSRLRIKLLGHADGEGKTGYNEKLSKQRAEAVKSYLVKQGVSPERLLVVGMGETKPTADNSTPAGRKKNRRVEFIIAED